MAKKSKTQKTKPKKKVKKEEFDFTNIVEPEVKKNTPMGPPRPGKLQKEIEEEMEPFSRGIL